VLLRADARRRKPLNISVLAPPLADLTSRRRYPLVVSGFATCDAKAAFPVIQRSSGGIEGSAP
jgi:hypothetical protein